MNYLLTLIDKLPILRDNIRTVIFMVLSGLFVGFTGFPLWVAYRNDKEVLEFILTLTEYKVTRQFTKSQMIAVTEALRQTLEQTGGQRVIFGVIADNNRIILKEHHRPVEEPLPLGFQTVYLPTNSYGKLKTKIREGGCFKLENPNDGSYFADEMNSTNSQLYVSCPSDSDWFLAVYVNQDDPLIEHALREQVANLENAGL